MRFVSKNNSKLLIFYMFSQTSSSSAFNQNIKTSYLLSSSSSIGRSVSQFWRLLSRRVLRPVNWLPSASFLFAAAPVRRSLSTHSTKPGCSWQSITSSLLEPLPLRQRPGLPWNSQRMDCWWRRMCFTSSTRQSSWITSPHFPSSHFECHETTTTSAPEKANQQNSRQFVSKLESSVDLFTDSREGK